MLDNQRFDVRLNNEQRILLMCACRLVANAPDILPKTDKGHLNNEELKMMADMFDYADPVVNNNLLNDFTL